MRSIPFPSLWILFLLILFVLTPNLSADHHTEAFEPSESQELIPAFRTALMTDIGKWDAYLGISGEFRTESEDLFALQTGGYYRVHRNLKMGLFYTLQKGERHDDDWVRSGDNWVWKDSSDRYENILTLDVSPRFLLPWMPGKNWLITSRLRYSCNLYNDQQKVLFRPDLSYFYMQNRKPVWNFNGGYALYVPLNFSEVPIYEHGPYLSVLYHLSSSVKLELFGDYQTRTWTSSSQYIDAGGSYEVDETRLRIGAAVIWTPKLL